MGKVSKTIDEYGGTFAFLDATAAEHKGLTADKMREYLQLETKIRVIANNHGLSESMVKIYKRRIKNGK